MASPRLMLSPLPLQSTSPSIGQSIVQLATCPWVTKTMMRMRAIIFSILLPIIPSRLLSTTNSANTTTRLIIIDWLVEWSVKWSTDQLIDWLDQLIDWLINRSRLINWSILINQSINQLIDCLINQNLNNWQLKVIIIVECGVVGRCYSILHIAFCTGGGVGVNWWYWGVVWPCR